MRRINKLDVSKIAMKVSERYLSIAECRQKKSNMIAVLVGCTFRSTPNVYKEELQKIQLFIQAVLISRGSLDDSIIVIIILLSFFIVESIRVKVESNKITVEGFSSGIARLKSIPQSDNDKEDWRTKDTDFYIY